MNINSIFNLNFLPPEQSVQVDQWMRSREWNVLGWLLLSWSGLILILFVAGIVLLRYRNQIEQTTVNDRQQLLQAVERELSSSNIQSKRQELNIIQQQINVSRDPSTLVGDISRSMASLEIDLSSLELDSTTGKIQLAGSVKQRSQLLTWIERLEALESIQQVSYPPAVLFAIEPIAFELELSI